ncbi:uncharacterized protein [Haliotis cracherodii]|uniref:uncharacterized protein n=1 Tax=Haliotis cracherodii TaxID=6455 RepID=UPI0039E81E8D
MEATNPQLSSVYFPIGNTRSVDVTLGCHVGRECDMLLLGCGDVRNVLHTMHILQTRGTTKSKDQRINIHLNDIEDSILGRDLILLYLAGTIDPNNSEDMKFLWGVWYDALLSQEHLQRLKKVMKEVASVQSGNSGVYFGNLKSEVSIKRALLGMEKADINGKQMIDTRLEYLDMAYRSGMPMVTMDWITGTLISPKVDLPQTAVDWMTARVSAHCGRLDKVPRLKDRYHQEIRDFISTGVTRVNSKSLSSEQIVDSFKGNITLLRPGCSIWKVPDSCCPFFCYDFDLELHRYDGRTVTLASLCLEILKKWVESFQAAMKDDCAIKIHMWHGEATEVCETDLPEDLRFDFIDTSNLADRVGLISVLSCSRDRLKSANGLLRTESFNYTKLEGYISVEIFLRDCIDVPILMYPTVFGLHLAEDISLGHESLLLTQCAHIRTKLTLKWKTAREQENLTALTLAENASDAVSKALEKIENYQGLDSGDPSVVKKMCVKRGTDKILKRIQNIAKDTNLLTHPPDAKKRSTVTEYTDHYLVTITTDPECLKEGTFSTDRVDGDPYVVELQNSQNGYSSFSETLRLSCGIALNSSNIKLSRKRGWIEACLVKDADVTMGERVLPWNKLNTNSAADLPNFPLSKTGKETLETYVASMCQVSAGKPSPIHQLRFLVEQILITVPFSSGVPTHITLRAPSHSHPAKRASKMLRLEGLKIHEDRPTLFLTFFDFDIAEVLVTQTKITNEEIMPWEDIKKTCGEMDLSSQRLSEGYALLMRILEVNSHRVIQDQSEDRRWITRTILRGRYPYTDLLTLNCDTELVQMVNSLCVPDIRTSGQSSPVSGASSGSLAARPGEVCDSCGKISENCKRCSKCLLVFYCGKACQRKAWKVHKKVCKSA